MEKINLLKLVKNRNDWKCVLKTLGHKPRFLCLLKKVYTYDKIYKNYGRYNMRIGIDLDGVVFDSELEYRICCELYEIQDLKTNTIVNNKELQFQKRYSWNDEETQGFITKYHKHINENSNIMPGARKVLNLLKEDGHTLIIVTAR